MLGIITSLTVSLNPPQLTTVLLQPTQFMAITRRMVGAGKRKGGAALGVSLAGGAMAKFKKW